MRKKQKYRPVYKRNYRLKNGKEQKIENTYPDNNRKSREEEKEEEEKR